MILLWIITVVAILAFSFKWGEDFVQFIASRKVNETFSVGEKCFYYDGSGNAYKATVVGKYGDYQYAVEIYERGYYDRIKKAWACDLIKGAWSKC